MVAGKAYDTNVLIRVHPTTVLPKRLGTFTLGTLPPCLRGDLLSRVLVGMRPATYRIHIDPRLSALGAVLLIFLPHQRKKHFVCELVDGVEVVRLELAGLGAEGTVGGVGVGHGELELVVDEGEALGTEAMPANEGEQVGSVLCTFAAFPSHSRLAPCGIH